MDPGDTEMVCTWQGKTSLTSCCVTTPLQALLVVSPAGGDERIFNSPVRSAVVSEDNEAEEEAPSELPTYVRLT